MSEGTQRRLAAIVSADVVGYSRLMGADEVGTLAAMRAHRAELWNPTIEQYGGRVVGTAGDSILVEYASAVAAVESSIVVQRGMVERNADLPNDSRMLLRIGINIGEVVIEGDDIYGDGVNVAARLQEIAEPGGITFSGNIHEQIEGKLDGTFTDDGLHEFKNIVRPVQVWRWSPLESDVPAAATVDVPLSLPDKPSIAVLPFENMSGDPDQEYFADGMVEEIITALSRLKWLFVIARNSSFTYKGHSVDIRQVASELGVRYVLEGSVRKAGEKVRITGQLIDAATGAHLWADRFDGDMEDIFDLQDQITTSVVGAIEPRLRLAEVERSRRKQTENLDAYDLYLRALPHVEAITIDDNIEALALLEKAIAIDPNFAPATAYAAWCYEQRVVRGWSTAAESDIEKGVKLARAAIAADSEDATAVGTAGFVLLMLGREFDAGLAALQHALDLSPNSAILSMMFGWANIFAGDVDVALASYERARRLSPNDPHAYFFLVGTGMVHLLSGRYDEAAEIASKSAALYADWDTTYWVLAPAYGYLGRAEDAKTAIARLLALAPGSTVSRYRGSLPFRDNDRLEIVLEGLRKAGLPE
ncbi:MAG: adenylate/guanylate cyclase domain-containing protein [Phycisphaerales bacterium]